MLRKQRDSDSPEHFAGVDKNFLNKEEAARQRRSGEEERKQRLLHRLVQYKIQINNIFRMAELFCSETTAKSGRKNINVPKLFTLH